MDGHNSCNSYGDTVHLHSIYTTNTRDAMKLLDSLRQKYMIAKAPFKPDSYCNCCGKEIGFMGSYPIIKYGKPTVYLCHVCKWDYSDYSRHKDKYDFFSKIT